MPLRRCLTMPLVIADNVPPPPVPRAGTAPGRRAPSPCTRCVGPAVCVRTASCWTPAPGSVSPRASVPAITAAGPTATDRPSAPSAAPGESSLSLSLSLSLSPHLGGGEVGLAGSACRMKGVKITHVQMFPVFCISGTAGRIALKFGML